MRLNRILRDYASQTALTQVLLPDPIILKPQPTGLPFDLPRLCRRRLSASHFGLGEQVLCSSAVDRLDPETSRPAARYRNLNGLSLVAESGVEACGCQVVREATVRACDCVLVPGS